jgi:hypothetical protein
MAVETGDAFHQSDQQFQQTMRENLPVLWYQTKVAPAPFDLVKGPDALDVVVNPESKTIQAQINDASNGRDQLVAAEVVLDPNAAPGTGVALTAADGSFNSTTEQVGGSIETLFPNGAPKPGTLAYVRGRDAKGNWGPLTAQWLAAPATPTPPPPPAPPKPPAPPAQSPPPPGNYLG